MSPNRTAQTPTLQIQRVTVRTGLRAGRELTPRCSVRNDCTTAVGG